MLKFFLFSGFIVVTWGIIYEAGFGCVLWQNWKERSGRKIFKFVKTMTAIELNWRVGKIYCAIWTYFWTGGICVYKTISWECEHKNDFAWIVPEDPSLAFVRSVTELFLRHGCVQIFAARSVISEKRGKKGSSFPSESCTWFVSFQDNWKSEVVQYLFDSRVLEYLIKEQQIKKLKGRL